MEVRVRAAWTALHLCKQLHRCSGCVGIEDACVACVSSLSAFDDQACVRRGRNMDATAAMSLLALGQAGSRPPTAAGADEGD